MNSKLDIIRAQIQKLEWDMQFIRDEDLRSFKKKRLDQYNLELKNLKGETNGVL